MTESIFLVLTKIEDLLWGYIAVPLVLLLGIFFTLNLKFPQILNFKASLISFYKSLFKKDKEETSKHGIPPLSAFFTSIGGCIGVANLVGVCTAIKIGGPGAVFWMWIAAFLGMAIKYSEVYLGVKFRIKNKNGSYDGGPMFYLQKIFNSKTIPLIFAALFAFYGTEIYMFSLIVNTIQTNWDINIYIIIALFLGSILYAVSGGIARVGKVSSFIIPLFLLIFVSMALWVLYQNSSNIIPTFILIFKSAFTGHAAVGGFAGSSIILAMSQGMARGCYSGDIGVGYASIVHAESSHSKPENQANLSILGIFLDTFIICTFTTLIVLVTNTWKGDYAASQMTQIALSKYFPHMKIFMPLFLFIVGYSSIIAFFVVGLKCADFISPKWGKKIYYLFGTFNFVIFSFVSVDLVYTIMTICGGLLLVLNVYGIFKLRKEL